MPILVGCIYLFFVVVSCIVLYFTFTKKGKQQGAQEVLEEARTVSSMVDQTITANRIQEETARKLAKEAQRKVVTRPY